MNVKLLVSQWALKLSSMFSGKYDVLLYRYEHTNKYTVGKLFVKGKTFYTMEPPWNSNKRSLSCIPTGIYDVNFLPRSYSGKYVNVYHVINVPNRNGILIHAGNTVKDTTGCIMPGLKVTYFGKLRAVKSSSLAMSRLKLLLGKKSFKLKIVGAPYV